MLASASLRSAASRRWLTLETRRTRRQSSATSPTTPTTTQQQIGCRPAGALSPSLKASALCKRERRSHQTPIYHSRCRSCSRSVATGAAASSSDYSSSTTTSPSSSPSTSSSSSPPPPPTPHQAASLPTVVLGVALVVSTGVVNRLLSKASIDACGPRLALFLALLQASAPALAYSLILWLRVRAGLTTREELDAPPTLPLLAVGAGEASSSVLGFLVASRLPGAALPMLAQSMLVWQMGFESFFLKRRQTRGKLVGAAMVVAGVCLAAWPAKTVAAKATATAAKTAAAAAATATAASAIPLGAALTYVFAQSFPAAAALAKERIFARAAEKLNSGSSSEEGGSGSGRDGDGAAAAATTTTKRKRRQLDTFVVSARSSVAQAAVVAALLPLSALLGPARLSLKDLPRYLLDGARAVAGLSSSDGLVPPPPGFPALPLSYVAANVLFNVALLRLLRAAGAFVYGAGAALLVPAAIVAFSVRWPFLPALGLQQVGGSSSLGPHFVLGAVVLVAGLAVVVVSARGGEEGKAAAAAAAAAAAPAAAAGAAVSAAAAGKSKSVADDSDDDEQKFLLCPPLLGDVGLEAA